MPETYLETIECPSNLDVAALDARDRHLNNRLIEQRARRITQEKERAEEKEREKEQDRIRWIRHVAIPRLQAKILREKEVTARQQTRRLRKAWLYQITFTDGMIYIGSTARSPFSRLNEHAKPIKPNHYTILGYAINNSSEIRIKILAIGSQNYIMALETAAIRRFDAINPTIGYNQLA